MRSFILVKPLARFLAWTKNGLPSSETLGTTLSQPSKRHNYFYSWPQSGTLSNFSGKHGFWVCIFMTVPRRTHPGPDLAAPAPVSLSPACRLRCAGVFSQHPAQAGGCRARAEPSEFPGAPKSCCVLVKQELVYKSVCQRSFSF